MADLKPFDGQLDAPTSLKPFDGQLDGEPAKPAGAIRKLADAGLSVAKGIVAVPEAAAGLADLVTGGRAGKLAESAGVRFKDAKDVLTGWQSDDLKTKQQQFQDTDGIIGKTGVALSNPSLIANTVAESLPLMGAGGIGARALLGAAPKMGAATAAGLGEGIAGAGSSGEQIRQESADGLLTGKQAALAGASGAATAAFGAAGGKLAQKLGIGDIDTMIAGGTTKVAAGAAPKGVIRRMAEGAASEGLLEELPQSLSEQGLQNVALDRPVTQGMEAAGVLGALTGGVMGAGAGAISRQSPEPGQTPPVTPPAPEPAAPLPDVGIPTTETPAPVKPSEAMGLNPAAGPMSAAATIAVDTGVHEGIKLQEANAADQAAYEQATNEQAQQAAKQDSIDKPITTGPIAEAAMSDEDKRAILFSNQPVLDGGIKFKGTQDGDILNGMSKPYPTRFAAQRRARMEGADWTIAQVQDGFVARRKDANGTTDAIPSGATNSAPVPATDTAGAVATGPGANAGPATDTARANPVDMVPAAVNTNGMPDAAVAPFMRPEDVMRNSIDSAAQELAMQIHNNSEDADFDPKEVPQAIAQWAKDANIPTDDLRMAVKAEIEKRAFRRKAGVLQAINPLNQAKNEQNPQTPPLTAPVEAPGKAPQAVEGNAAAPAGLPAKGTGTLEAAGIAKELDKVSSRFWKGETFRDIAPRVARSPDVYTKKEPKFTGTNLLDAATEFDYFMTDGRRSQKISKQVYDHIESLKPNSASTKSAPSGVTQPPPTGNIASTEPASTGNIATAAPSIDDAAHTAATSKTNDLPQPTEAQKQAGNYPKGHVNLNGLDLSIENPAGSVRSGKDKTGKAWSNALQHHYGYIKGTIGNDKDHVDLFVKPGTPLDYSGQVFVIDQIHPDTNRFDEHKVVVGAKNGLEARRIYQANYAKGWKGFKAMTAMPFDQFKTWVKDGPKNKPLSSEKQDSQPQGSSNEEAPKAIETTPKQQAPAASGVAEPGYGNVANSETMDLRKLAHVTEKPGDVMLGNDKFVTEAQAMAAAKSEMTEEEWGRPFQFNRVLDIAPRDWNRMVLLMTGKEYGSNFANKPVTPQLPPAAPKKTPLKQRIEQARQARNDYFTPGNIVQGYSGYDRVISYKAPDDKGEGWNVTVQSVVKQDGKWVVDPKDNRVRTHSTQPDARELAKGPVEKASAVEPQLERTATEHVGVKIYPVTFKGEPRWSVQTSENKISGKVLGDTIHTTLDDAKKEAELQVARDKSQAERNAAYEAEQAAAQAKKDSNKGKSLAERKRDFDLDKPTKLHPNAGLGTGTRRESMQKAVDQERHIEAATVRDEAAKKRDTEAMDRARRNDLPTGNINYPGVKEYFEAAARLKADKYEKPEYRVYDGRDNKGSFREITKTEYDYAQELKATSDVSKNALEMNTSQQPVQKTDKSVQVGKDAPSEQPASVADAAVDAKQANRFEIGKSLTKEQRKKVLGTLIDVYKAKGAPRESKGLGRDGEERFGYAFSPDLFEKSDITGAMVRYHVTLPDGKLAHPSELFEGYTQSDIDAALEQQNAEERNAKANDESRRNVLRSRIRDNLSEANRIFNLQNPGRANYTPAIITNGSQFLRTAPESAERDAKLLGDGWEAKSSEQSVAQETIPTDRIDDFGEKLLGARKDYAALMKDAEAVDISAEPLSKSWPEPDYQKLIESGVTKRVVAMVRSMRDEIPTKPQKSWKLKTWVEQVTLLRSMTNNMLNGDISKEALDAKLNSKEFALLREQIGGRADLYEAVGHDKSLRGVTFKQHLYGLYKGERNVIKWVIEQQAKATAWSNFPKEIVAADTREQALKDFIAKFDSLDLGKSKAKPGFILYGKRGQKGTWIGKKIGREYIDLKKFDEVKEARAYLDENSTVLESLLARYKDTPYERNEENAPRVGGDHRNGAPVTPEIFGETFGFRGVQFGNYVEQGRRQSDLNEAFDALMDMAAVLGIPPKAISLNGRLGLAFGARGKGGKNAPAAHYEPGLVVINLTKGGGPGSLAHEWFHSMDNYFAKEGGVMSEGDGSYMTGNARGDALRAEMHAAFTAIKRAVMAGALKIRSQELDKRRTSAYWATPIEMAARSFEGYIIAKLQDQNASNDYLANIVSQKMWEASDALRLGPDIEQSAEPSYPYPTVDEMPVIRAAFDDFFKTVQTKETDKGVAMFSRKDQTDTAAFKAWFGDSKVVDTQGEPLLVYHGTTSDFSEFDKSKIKRTAAGTGFFFTTDSGQQGYSEGEGANVMPVYLSIKNPTDNPAVFRSDPSYDGLIFPLKSTPGVTHIAVRDPTQIKSATGNSGNFDGTNPDIRYARGQFSTAAQTQATESVEKLVNAIAANWANAPEIIVAFDMQDDRIPERVRQEDLKQRSGGAIGTPEGFYYAGKVYMMSSQLVTPNDVARVLAHEALGHAGLRGLFGDTLKPILQQIATMRKAEVQAKARQYGLDVNNRGDMLTAAEEVLAVLAQTKPEMGFVQRAIAAIRSWLRANVPGFSNMKMTDADIIANFITPARRFIEGKGQPAGGNIATQLAFGRGTNAAMNNAKVGTAFNAMVKNARSDLEGVLFNWQEVELNEDGDRLIARPGRDGFYSKGKDGGAVSITKRSFIEWLQSEGPFDTKIYGPAIAENAEWVQQIKTLRDIIATVTNPNDVVGNQGGRSADDSTPGDLLKRLEGTKVIDDQGKPLLVYHGGNEKIEVFDPKKQGEKTKSASANMGFFFTDSSRSAQHYLEPGFLSGGREAAYKKSVLDKTHEYKKEDIGLQSMQYSDGSIFGYGPVELLKLNERIRDEFEKLNPEIALEITNSGFMKETDSGKAKYQLRKVLEKFYPPSVTDTVLGYTGLATNAMTFESRLSAIKKTNEEFGIGNHIGEYFLRIVNPKTYSFKGGKAAGTISKITESAKANGHDGVIFRNTNDGGPRSTHYVVFNPDQIIPATKNESTAPDSGGASFSRSISNTLNDAVNERKTKIVGEAGRQYTQAQLAAMKAVGFQVELPSLKDRAQALWQDAGKKLAQGIVDQFAPIKDIDKDAYGLLRLAKGASGAFEVFMHGGQLKLDGGVYNFDEGKRGGVVEKLLQPLQTEHHDFFRWVAANRAERLMGEGKENLFSKSDIASLKTLAEGATSFDYTIKQGLRKGQVTRDRALIYADSLKTFNEFQNNVLDMAEQSGLIDGEARKLWEHEFYVPFYRIEDDGSVAGAHIKNGVVRQQAFKSLTGRVNKLNADLMDNTLMNWAHLLDASAKNRAAKATIEAVEKMGAAIPLEASAGKGSVWFRENGQKRWALIDDPMLLTAVSALEYAGMRNPVMDAMGMFKRVLTIGVTASPFFKIRNLIRDSVQVLGTSKINPNPAINIARGWKLTDPKSDAYFRLLAGGGTIHFGTMLEGSESKRVQSLVESGVDDSTILGDEHKVKAFYRKYLEPGITAYNELGNRGEAINRASLYDQLVAGGMSHAEASLQARDLMDFSMQGSFTSIRFLTQVVPFFNARIQGLYKLGRAAKEDPARFGAVLGATALFSLALLAAYSDDDDWKNREEWDRNNYWWFKFGGTAFRIPKPFEIGAIATLAERGFELAFDNEMTGERFRKQVLTLLGDNLSMNPVPQLVKPILDVYANKNSFSGRPIETMGMERLKSEYRFTDRTSMTARGLSTAANSVAGLVGGEALSPVQIDHMLRGYFGWLGSFIVGTADKIARPATGQNEHPSSDMWKTLTGGIVSDMRDAPSRYVSQMYEQAREIEQAYGTWRALQKEGKAQEAAEFAQDNQAKLSKYHFIERIKRQESSANQRIRMIERSEMDGDSKRELIRNIQAQKDQIARQVTG